MRRGWRTLSGVVRLCSLAGSACFLAVSAQSQPQAQLVPFAGPNVNMVSGTDPVTGDPFLQRQNEPTIAVSTRNPLHLLAGGNDYRTVDIPGVPDTGEELVADAW